MAGFRKLGYASTEDVKLAVLEETGHVSAVPREQDGSQTIRAQVSNAIRITIGIGTPNSTSSIERIDRSSR